MKIHALALLLLVTTFITHCQYEVITDPAPSLHKITLLFTESCGNETIQIQLPGQSSYDSNNKPIYRSGDIQEIKRQVFRSYVVEFEPMQALHFALKELDPHLLAYCLRIAQQNNIEINNDLLLEKLAQNKESYLAFYRKKLQERYDQIAQTRHAVDTFSISSQTSTWVAVSSAALSTYLYARIRRAGHDEEIFGMILGMMGSTISSIVATFSLLASSANATIDHENAFKKLVILEENHAKILQIFAACKKAIIASANK